MTPPLHSNKLVKCLESRARKDNHAAALFGVLQPIVDDISPLLEFIRHSFPGYPKHGIDHSLRILERIGGILSQAALNSLSTNELFCLVLAALFHDAGMVAPESTTPDDQAIRSTHHKRSADLFLRYFPERVPLLSNTRMAEVIAFTIECHGLNWEQMQSKPQFTRYETLDGQPIRPCVLALLLRIGDLLDLDSDRTSELCLKYCASWYHTPDAIDHNDRHRHVRHFFYDEKRIEVEVECPNRKQYDIWFSWLEYLRMDIERANTYVFYDSLAVFRLPVPVLKCVPSKEAKFELWPLRFEIDESGTLWDLISRSIYTGKHDFLRELIQNAIDACLRLIYEAPKGLTPAPSPRNWSLADFTPTVLVVLNAQHQEILVADNGIGMGRQAIQDFLFRVAGSGMKGLSKDRPFGFPSIATFGIGFISVLTRASSLRLITRPALATARGQDREGLSIELDANLRDAIVEKEPASRVGTTIILKARASEYLVGVEEYLLSKFRYPSVDICLLDWTKLQALVDTVNNNNLRVDLAQFHEAEKLLAAPTGEIDHLRITIKRFVESANAAIITENDLRRREISELGGQASREPLPYIGNPLLVVKAHAPESLPTAASWCFTLDKKAEVKSGRKLKTGSPTENLLSNFIMVPVEFSDEVNGIEWRSLHSFLVARGEVTQSMSFVKTEEFGSRSFVMPTDILAQPDMYYSEIMDQVEGSHDDPYDLVEMMRIRHEQRNQDYEPGEYRSGLHGPMLVSDCDGIKRYRDVDYELVDGWKDADAESFFDSAFLVGKEADEALDWFRRGRHSVYQDGIRLPLSIGDLAPIGSLVGVANFLGVSRLTYNVSRNAIDQSEDKLRAWRSDVGSLILRRVASAVKASLDQLEIEYSWKNLWTGDSDGSLARLTDWMQLSKH